VDDEIAIHYNNKEYRIRILEAKPQNAISIIEADIEVDFAPPVDYVPEVKQPPQTQPIPIGGASDKPSESGSGFSAFSGRGNSLKGNSLPKSPSTTPTFNSTTTTTTSTTPNSSYQTPPTDNSGAPKLVFGGGARLNDPKTTTPSSTSAQKETPKEEASFKAFSGKAYSLK